MKSKMTLWITIAVALSAGVFLLLDRMGVVDVSTRGECEERVTKWVDDVAAGTSSPSQAAAAADEQYGTFDFTEAVRAVADRQADGVYDGNPAEREDDISSACDVYFNDD